LRHGVTVSERRSLSAGNSTRRSEGNRTAARNQQATNITNLSTISLVGNGLLL